jgi:hypothetical protein
MTEIDLKTYKPAETVPQELLDLAHAHYSMHGNGLLFNLIAAVLPAHERMVREQVAHELEAEGKKVADEAAYKVAAGDDGGFSGVLRGASISWAAKFVRGEATV